MRQNLKSFILDLENLVEINQVKDLRDKVEVIKQVVDNLSHDKQASTEHVSFDTVEILFQVFLRILKVKRSSNCSKE